MVRTPSPQAAQRWMWCLDPPGVTPCSPCLCTQGSFLFMCYVDACAHAALTRGRCVFSKALQATRVTIASPEPHTHLQTCAAQCRRCAQCSVRRRCLACHPRVHHVLPFALYLASMPCHAPCLPPRPAFCALPTTMSCLLRPAYQHALPCALPTSMPCHAPCLPACPATRPAYQHALPCALPTSMPCHAPCYQHAPPSALPTSMPCAAPCLPARLALRRCRRWRLTVPSYCENHQLCESSATTRHALPACVVRNAQVQEVTSSGILMV